GKSADLSFLSSNVAIASDAGQMTTGNHNDTRAKQNDQDLSHVKYVFSVMMRRPCVLDSTKFKDRHLSRAPIDLKAAAPFLRHYLHLHCIDEDTVDIKFHAVIARRPSIVGPPECECASCGRACSNGRGLVDFIILRKIFADVLRDPHSLDVCSLPQTLAVPARVNFRRVRRKCRRRLPEAIFRKTYQEPF